MTFNHSGSPRLRRNRAPAFQDGASPTSNALRIKRVKECKEKFPTVSGESLG